MMNTNAIHRYEGGPYETQFLDLSVGGIMGALVTVEAAEEVPREVLPGQPLFAFYNDPEIAAFAERFKTDPPASVTFRFNWYSAETETSADPEVVAAAKAPLVFTPPPRLPA